MKKKVVIDGNTKRIDVYIPETRVIIEQKSLGKALDQKIRNSGDVDLTPFEQADRYNGKLTLMKELGGLLRQILLKFGFMI